MCQIHKNPNLIAQYLCKFEVFYFNIWNWFTFLHYHPLTQLIYFVYYTIVIDYFLDNQLVTNYKGIVYLKCCYCKRPFMPYSFTTIAMMWQLAHKAPYLLFAIIGYLSYGMIAFRSILLRPIYLGVIIFIPSN